MLLLMTTLGYLCLAGGVLGQGAKNASACLRMATCTGSMSLQCGPDQRVFVTRMLYGSKPSGGACSTTPSCSSCCQPDNNDCFAEYTGQDFGTVYNACWDKQNCTSQVRPGLTICDGTSLSTFSVAEYVCLGSGHVTQFHVNTTVTAPAVAIHYDAYDVTNYPVATGDNQTWHCQVDTVDCVQRQADVILVKESYTFDSTRCSILEWSERSFMSCDKEFQYKRFHATTPFRVSLKVDNTYRVPSLWAVIRAQDGGNLVVTCRNAIGVTERKHMCTGTPTAASMQASVSLSASVSSKSSTSGTNQTTRAASTSTATPTTTTTITPTATTFTTTTPASTTTLTSTTSPTSLIVTAAGAIVPTSQTGVAVAGWILAAGLAILLVIGAVYVRRRGGLRQQTTSGTSNAARDHSQDTEHSAGVIPMEVAPHRKLSSENGDRFSHSPRPSEYVNVASSRTSSAAEYVNAASSQAGFSSAESRPESQQEYSSLSWSRDQANSYAYLKKL